MLLRMLKKDLLRKKAMNVVLFLLIALCTTVMASGVSNLFTTSAAIDNFAKETNVADYYLLVPQMGTDEQAIDSWLASSTAVTNYRKQESLVINQDKTLYNDKEITTNSVGISVCPVPQGGDYVFDGEQRVTNMDSGQVAIGFNLAHNNGIVVGDTIQLTSGDITKTLTVSSIIKDMLYGSDFMGFNRAIISNSDYASLTQDANAVLLTYSLYSDNPTQMNTEKNALQYTGTFEFDGPLLYSTFIMEMITLGMLVIVAVLLVLVALVLLHFTIAFTIQEDYREIGIMKGLGVGDATIKRLYVTKYLYLSLAAALVGFGLSFLLSGALLSSLANTVVIGQTGDALWIRIACALLVVLLAIAFAWIGARKVQRLTAIQAIRSGSLGERYRRKGLVRLNASKRMPVPFFMAINDIFSGVRNYLSLVIALAFGILMVLLPANAANTLKSEEANAYFGYGGIDVVIDAKHYVDYLLPGGHQLMLDDIAKLEQDFAEQGVPIELNFRYGYTSKVYADNPGDALTIAAMGTTPGDELALPGLEGYEPVLANEIAMTRIVMEELGVSLGDTVHVIVGSTDKPYIISGSTEVMVQMGRTLFFSGEAPLQDETVSNANVFKGNFVNRTDIPEQIDTLKANYPSYSFSTPSEYIVNSIGDIHGTINDMKNLLLLLALVVDALVVVLLAKTLLARDKGEIALLKSLGFQAGSLMLWQIARLLIVALFALVLGILLTIPLNPVMVSLTFGMMGAPNIPSVIVPLETFVLYPAIMVGGTLLAVTLSVLSVRKINKNDFEAIE